jgi:hypothetical protein
MKTATLLSLIIALTTSAGNAQSVSDKVGEPKASNVEKALNDALVQSVNHSFELSAREVELTNRLVEMAKQRPRNEKLGAMPQTQRDEWDLVTTQLAYLTKSAYREVLKRRGLTQVLNLVKAFEIQDKANEAFLLYGKHSTLEEASAEAEGGWRREFGSPAADFWIKALKGIDAAQQISDAESIPLKGLVERIRFSASSPNISSDALEFINTAGFPNTPAGQFFLERLLGEVQAGNSDAIEAFKYFDSVYHLLPQSPAKK